MIWEAQRWSKILGGWVACCCCCHERGPLADGEKNEDREHDVQSCGGWHRIRGKALRGSAPLAQAETKKAPLPRATTRRV